MGDLAQKPAGTERTQQNSLDSELGLGYHFTSRGCTCSCSCPLTTASQSARYWACYQLPELRSRSLQGVQICTGSSSSAQLQSSLPAGMQA